jgi:hypothetical protein
VIPTGDPKIDASLAALEAICVEAVTLNDPRTSGHGSRATGKPESRSPGRQQCPGVAKEVARILEQAVLWGSEALAGAAPRTDAPATFTAEEEAAIAAVREQYPNAPRPFAEQKRTIGVDATKRHLAAKYAEVARA